MNVKFCTLILTMLNNYDYILDDQVLDSALGVFIQDNLNVTEQYTKIVKTCKKFLA